METYISPGIYINAAKLRQTIADDMFCETCEECKCTMCKRSAHIEKEAILTYIDSLVEEGAYCRVIETTATALR